MVYDKDSQDQEIYIQSGIFINLIFDQKGPPTYSKNASSHVTQAAWTKLHVKLQVENGRSWSNEPMSGRK